MEKAPVAQWLKGIGFVAIALWWWKFVQGVMI
jgi:hypothetical protein